MESLKLFSEITEPDERSFSFVKLNFQTGSFSRFTLGDFHHRAESIVLHAGVPENIRSHFETARNLIIYSWFYYPFNVTAQLTAYTTVEFALRTRFNDRETPFKHLLKKAVHEGLVTDKGFSIPQKRAEAVRQNNTVVPEDFQMPEPSLMSEYSANLAKCIPFLRNQLAHGTNMLHEQGAKHVRICAELINQLFPLPTPPTS